MQRLESRSVLRLVQQKSTQSCTRIATVIGNPINSVNTKLGTLYGNGQGSKVSVGMICGIPGRLGSGKLERQLMNFKGLANWDYGGAVCPSCAGSSAHAADRLDTVLNATVATEAEVKTAPIAWSRMNSGGDGGT